MVTAQMLAMSKEELAMSEEELAALAAACEGDVEEFLRQIAAEVVSGE